MLPSERVEDTIDVGDEAGNKDDIGGTTLDSIIWSLVDTHWNATFGLNHMKVLQSNVIQP